MANEVKKTEPTTTTTNRFELTPQEQLQVADIQNLLQIVEQGTYPGAQAEYIAVLKQRLRRTVEYLSQA